jgi:hypothetical protein
MGMFVGFGCLCYGLAAVLVLAVASALLRVAITLANRTIGPVNPGVVIGWDWDADEDDEPVEPEGPSPAIPEPGLGQGMAFVFLAAVVNTVLGFGLRFVLTVEAGRDRSDDGPIAVAAHLIGLVAGFLTLLALLASSLPTTPRRAALAALIFHLLLLAIAAGLAVLGFGLLGIR